MPGLWHVGLKIALADRARALIAGSIALLSVWGLRRGRTWGFLGAFFLVILAPTSSIVPLRDPVFEHRMYLPLAAVAAAGVLGAFGLWNALAQRWKFADLPPLRRWALPAIVLVAAVAALGIRTILRNCDYSSTVAIWQDTVAKAPANPRAHYTFGTILMTDANDVPRAMEQFCDAIGLAPDYADAHANLGVALFGQGNTDQAVPELREAIRLNPNLAHAHNDLGLVLAREKKPDQAAEEFRETLRLSPNRADTHINLGAALVTLGKLEEAMDHFRQAIRLDARSSAAHKGLAIALDRSGRHEEATQALNQAAAIESSQNAP